MRLTIIVTACAVLLTAITPVAAHEKFVERNYDGCATKSEMFAQMRSYGLNPRKIVKVVPGKYVLIRARGLKTGDWYDYAFLPCQMMIDGRFPIEH